VRRAQACRHHQRQDLHPLSRTAYKTAPQESGAVFLRAVWGGFFAALRMTLFFLPLPRKWPSPHNRPRLYGDAITAAKPRGDFKGETACFPLDDPLLLWTGDGASGTPPPAAAPTLRRVILSGAKDLIIRRAWVAGRVRADDFRPYMPRRGRCSPRWSWLPPHQSACADSFPSRGSQLGTGRRGRRPTAASTLRRVILSGAKDLIIRRAWTRLMPK